MCQQLQATWEILKSCMLQMFRVNECANVQPLEYSTVDGGKILGRSLRLH
jgi:hypothetical protein